MSKKLFLLLVAIFAMVYVVKAEENVDAANTAETDEVAPGNKAEAKAEINEINAQEKAKEAEADANIKDEGQKEVAKEEVEDKAAGIAEAKIKGEEVKKEAEKLADEPAEKAEPAAKEKSGGWFSWLWPFGGSEKKEEAKADAPAEKAVPAEKAKEKPAEEAKEEMAEEEAPAAEKAKEPVVEKVPAKETEKPVAETAAQEKSGSWFSWLWPFGGSEKKAKAKADAPAEKAAPVVEEKEEVAVEEVPPVAVVEEKEAVVEPVPAEAAPAEPEVAVKGTDNKGCGGKTNIGRKILFYIPNILLNLTDIFSGGIAVGAEAGLEARITRYFQFGGQYGDAYFIEKGFDRRFGGGYDDGYSFHLAALTGEKRFVDKTFGGVKGYILDAAKARVNAPEDIMYAPDSPEQEKDAKYKTKKRDFWAIGLAAGWLINVSFDIHPVQLVDFLASIFFMDMTGDSIE